MKDRISVYSFNSGGLRRLGTFTGSNNATSYYIKAKLSPDGSMLASGSTNDDVCLWQVDCPGPPMARLKVGAMWLGVRFFAGHDIIRYHS